MSDDIVRIFDTTLRDGEQSPGCSMNLPEKLSLARQLEKLGVDVIEAGFPIASEGDFESVQAVARELRETSVCGLARTGREDVERAVRALEPAVRPRVHTFIATSDIHLKHKLRMSREQVLEEVDRAVRQARGFCDDVEFSAEDATRSDWEYLVQVFDTAVAAGATTCNVPDTVGYTTPSEYAALIGHLKENVQGADRVTFSVHCHNDLGLAVANSLAAVQAGARQIECTVNGIGERAGNTSTEEVVMAIKTRRDVFAGVDTAIRTTEIYPSSRLLSSIIGVPVQPNKAVVGANAFAHEAGIHQDGVLKAPITYEIMTPESIGRASNELVMGKHSGRHAFRERLLELGYELEDEEFQRAFKRFKDLADAKKTIFNEDLEAIVSDSVVATDDRFSLGDMVISSGTFPTPSATVQLLVDEEPRKTTALGVGPVDALFKAITELTDTKCELIRYQVHAVTAGLDALGEVSVTVSEDGRRVIGHGAHEDVLVASAKAYVHAINKLEWHKRRHQLGEPTGI
ncbi:MAG: 2-isopropylmalate synthase [Proteobacteria bacterium]|nr:2-isopropylmalate synthase [Pseudomonadota bacterium]MCZ6785396.1 2-isopropylmalate synthase [Pseudomonadota bacterium]